MRRPGLSTYYKTAEEIIQRCPAQGQRAGHRRAIGEVAGSIVARVCRQQLQILRFALDDGAVSLDGGRCRVGRR